MSSLSMRRFADIDLGREPVPDETTVCKFRHLLECHDLGRKLFERVHRGCRNFCVGGHTVGPEGRGDVWRSGTS